MKKALESFQQFAGIVLRGDESNRPSGELKQLISDIQSYNEDPDNSDSLPWIFISKSDSDGLTEGEISEILAMAESEGLGGDFRITSSGDFSVLAFTNSGRYLADIICHRMGLAYSNLLGCGLVIDNTIILSPYLSSDQRIRRELEVVEMMLGVKSV